jgi:hypothetical protein
MTDLVPIHPTPKVVESDDMLRRAREALAASGDFPGMAEAIRAGMMDHLSGIRIAVAVQENINVPLEQLPMVNHPPLPVHEPVRTGWMHQFMKWCERMQHRAIRLYTRYDSAKQRNLKLAAELVYTRSALAQSASSKAVARLAELAPYDKEYSMAAFLHSASPEERKALIKLAKTAIVTRKHNHNNNEKTINLSISATTVSTIGATVYTASTVPTGGSGVKPR